MGNELNDAIKIGVECIVFGLIVMLLYFTGSIAQDMVFQKVMKDSVSADIVEYRELYGYTGGVYGAEEDFISSSGGVYSLSTSEIGEYGQELYGSDIVQFVLDFKGEYNVLILDKNVSGSYYVGYKLDAGSGDTLWDYTLVSDYLGLDVQSKYLCIGLYNDLLYELNTILFYRWG